MEGAIISFVVQKLGDFLIAKAKLLGSVKSEVEWLQRELKLMKGFLKDAEEKRDTNEGARQWLLQIRDVAYDVEDVLDNFILKIEEDIDNETCSPPKGLLTFIRKCFGLPQKLITLYYTRKEIGKLRARVEEISRQRETYGIKYKVQDEEKCNPASVRLRQLRRTTSYMIDEVVGFNNDAELLLAKLLHEEPHRWVISIFGMGGLGKTTLARKLYHSTAIQHKFRCFGWVCVSQDYDTKDLLQRLIKSFKTLTKEEMENMTTEEDLERYLRNVLADHRYLAVIDDVWHMEAWESLKRALPDNRNGSRVIITTRNTFIAERLDERSYSHALRFLNPEESWELFCRKMFPNKSIVNRENNNLKIAEEMVGKCGGLPLAIIVLGGLLSVKKPVEWCIIREHIWRNLRENDPIHVKLILTLSFMDLPYYLRPCFLYLGLYPEDSLIKADSLCRIWVAEGFIKPRWDEDETLEGTAEDYLHQLIDRSLIQVAKRRVSRVTGCRVHDLLRDLAIEKARDLNFLHIFNGSSDLSLQWDALVSCRWHTLHGDAERYLSLDSWTHKLRSLVVFSVSDHFPVAVTRFKFLRVLQFHLRGGAIPDEIGGAIPDEIGTLIHLRYLRLSGGVNIGVLPSSILNLHNLLTLDVSDFGDVVDPPKNLSNMKKLRHLVGYFGKARLQGLERLTDLRTLKYVDYESWICYNPQKLANLRDLGINAYLLPRDTAISLDSIAALKKLQSLALISDDGTIFPRLQPLSGLPHLQRLFIKGRIAEEGLTGSGDRATFPKLNCLNLERSMLEDVSLTNLSKLMPNLISLELGVGSYTGKTLHFRKNCFPQLEFLSLHGLDNLLEWEVEEGAMFMLRGLRVNDCFRLEEIPHSLLSVPVAPLSEFEWPAY